MIGIRMRLVFQSILLLVLIVVWSGCRAEHIYRSDEYQVVHYRSWVWPVLDDIDLIVYYSAYAVERSGVIVAILNSVQSDIQRIDEFKNGEWIRIYGEVGSGSVYIIRGEDDSRKVLSVWEFSVDGVLKPLVPDQLDVNKLGMAKYAQRIIDVDELKVEGRFKPNPNGTGAMR